MKARPDSRVAAFLTRPLLAHVATLGTHGPTVRPVWYLYEDTAFWWLTGSYSHIAEQLAADPRMALVIDTCDLLTGRVEQIYVRGRAEVVALDRERAERKLARYLGSDMAAWPERFLASLRDPDTRLVRLVPDHPPALLDLSYCPSAGS